MTIRRQWLMALVATVFISITINSIVLGTLINRYFVDYSNENYTMHFNQIVEFSEKVLMEGDYSKNQLEIQLETHLSEPITKIQIFDKNDQLVVSVGENSNPLDFMMKDRMMSKFMGTFNEEVDSATIMVNGNSIGKLNIVKYSSVADSIGTRMFKNALIMNSFFAFAFVLLLVLISGLFVSKKMSKDLMNTAKQAIAIDLGEENHFKLSNVREIRIIQQKLEMLQSKLRLKQKSRKILVDELVHQTRTPLTILKTQLEGIEDGIIFISPEVISICEEQIDNVTNIINDISDMIDAEKEIEKINMEKFEINDFLKKITSGLKPQFEKKGLGLTLINSEQCRIFSDKHLLSQSIYNLLTNAYKFTEPGGNVQVEYYLDNKECILVVRDTGTGISNTEINKIFDPYYRSNKAEKIPGEGIGLYIVKENLKKIHGSIKVESMEGKGSAFIIRLPINNQEVLLDE